MSGHMKTRHTKILVDGLVFLLPNDKKESFITLIEAIGAKLQSIRNEPNINADEVLSGIYNKLPKGALHLQAARSKEGLSQKDLMNATGIAVYNISKMENGHRTIGKNVASKLAKVLKIDPELLLQK